MKLDKGAHVLVQAVRVIAQAVGQPLLDERAFLAPYLRAEVAALGLEKALEAALRGLDDGAALPQEGGALDTRARGQPLRQQHVPVPIQLPQQRRAPDRSHLVRRPVADEPADAQRSSATDLERGQGVALPCDQGLPLAEVAPPGLRPLPGGEEVVARLPQPPPV